MANYTIVIDESGEIQDFSKFVIGGYIVEHRDTTIPKIWGDDIFECIPKGRLKNEKNPNDFLAYHRTSFKSEAFKEAVKFTYKFFDEFSAYDKNNIKFHSFFYTELDNNKLMNIKSTGVLYVRMLVNLAIENCLNFVKKSTMARKKITINIISASRQDMNDNRILKLEEYKEYLDYILDELSMKHGVNKDKISINLDIRSATPQGAHESKKAGNIVPFDVKLVLADYFCNLAYSRKKEKDIYHKYKDKIHFSDYNSNDLDIYMYDYNRDYYNLLKLYVNYQCHHKDQGSKIERIKEAMKFQKFRDREYLVPAVISLLHYIEHESTRDKDYDKIIVMYDTLIEFVETLEHKEYFYLRFLVCREKLAVCNHSGNSKLGDEMFQQCEELLEELLKDFKYYPDIFIYNSICSNYLNSLYQSKKILQSTEGRLKAYEDYYQHNPSNDKNSLGNFYGTLLTACIYQYLVDKSDDTIKNAEMYMSRALECFYLENRNRTYTSALHLYRHTNNTRKWLETMYLCFNATEETLMENIKTEFDRYKNTPHNTEFNFIFREIVIYATYKDMNAPFVEELRKFIYENCQEYVQGQSQDGDPGISIRRDNALLVHLLADTDTSLEVKKLREYFNSVKRLSDSQEYSNIYDGMKALSLELVEQLITGRYAVKSSINRYRLTAEYLQALTLPKDIPSESDKAIKYYLNCIYT